MKNNLQILLTIFICLTLNQLDAQEITAFPGFWGREYYQDNQKISKNELSKLFRENETANALWEKANKQEIVASVFFAAQAGSAVWGAINYTKDKEITGPLIATFGTGIVGTIFQILSEKRRKEAILKYNDDLGQKTSINLQINSSGAGIVFTF